MCQRMLGAKTFPRGASEFRCIIQQKRKTYIPFNPYTGEEASLHRQLSKSGYWYYTFPTCDKDLLHKFEDGTTIPEYRWRLRKWLFQKFDDGIEIDSTGFLDVTPEAVSNHISNTMIALSNIGSPDAASDREEKKNSFSFPSFRNKKNLAILEGCCGYGGNTIAFSKDFDLVTAIDNDESRLEKAKRNANIYTTVTSDNSNIKWIKAELKEWCVHEAEREFPQHYAWGFLSPPWGGENYKLLERFKMRETVGESSAYDMLASMGSLVDNLAVYIPVNQDSSELAELASELPKCAAVVIEHIFVGLKNKPKYLVAYFLDEITAKQVVPRFHYDVASMLTTELKERVTMIPSIEFLLNRLGTKQILACLRKTCELSSAGGVPKLITPNEMRSRGGVFFSTIKENYIEVYRELNKHRKLKRDKRN